MVDHLRREREPTARLTRICDAMLETFKNHPEKSEWDSVIVGIECHIDGVVDAGIGLYNYESDMDAIPGLLIHTQAILQANGKDLGIGFLGMGPDDNGRG